MTGAAAVVAALAVYRFTLLVVADEVTAPPREWLVRRLNEAKHGPRPHDGMPQYQGDPGQLVLDQQDWHTLVARDPSRAAYLLECPWCASVHIGILGVWATVVWGHTTAWLVVAGGLAASGVTGYLASKASP